jgi:hypothetical protein
MGGLGPGSINWHQTPRTPNNSFIPRGNTHWPNGDGTIGGSTDITLPVGVPFWRYGKDDGRYVTLPLTPPWQLSLPWNNPGWWTGPSQWITTQPIRVKVGIVAPWFGQPGGGIQILLPAPLENLGGSVKQIAVPPFGW